METFNQIGPWITFGIISLIVLFFGFFYISKLIKSTRKIIVDNEVGDVVNPTTDENKKKLREEIVQDIVDDITPVLKKRIEKAF